MATIMVILRVYARFFQTKTAQLDDWLVIAALPPGIVLAVMVVLLAEHHGFDIHIWDFDPGLNGSNLVTQRLMEWVSEMLYLWSSSLTKLSLLVFYQRIFVERNIRIFTYGFMYFVVCYFVVFFLALLLECRPVSFYWTAMALPQDPNGGKCADESNLLFVSGVVNVFIDVVILILPIPMVLKLKIRLQQKLQVLAVFLAGLTVVASSSIRVAATLTTTRTSYDVTWEGYLVWMWVGIEVDIGLICASVPACRGLLTSWQKKFNSSLSQQRYSGARNTPSYPQNNGSSSRAAFKSNGGGSYMEMSETNGLPKTDNLAHWVGSTQPGTVGSMRERCSDDEEFELEFLGEGHESTRAPVPPERVYHIGKV